MARTHQSFSSSPEDKIEEDEEKCSQTEASFTSNSLSVETKRDTKRAMKSRHLTMLGVFPRVGLWWII